MRTNQRKSYTAIEKIYFWRATIHKWNNLLEDDAKEDIIISSLKKLSDDKVITVYALPRYSCRGAKSYTSHF